MTDTATCRACGAPIRWGRGANGKPSPLNAEPDPAGNIIIAPDGFARYRRKDAPLAEGTPRYTSHFATCPQADDFRRKR